MSRRSGFGEISKNMGFGILALIIIAIIGYYIMNNNSKQKAQIAAKEHADAEAKAQVAAKEHADAEAKAQVAAKAAKDAQDAADAQAAARTQADIQARAVAQAQADALAQAAARAQAEAQAAAEARAVAQAKADALAKAAKISYFAIINTGPFYSTSLNGPWKSVPGGIGGVQSMVNLGGNKYGALQNYGKILSQAGPATNIESISGWNNTSINDLIPDNIDKNNFAFNSIVTLNDNSILAIGSDANIYTAPGLIAGYEKVDVVGDYNKFISVIQAMDGSYVGTTNERKLVTSNKLSGPWKKIAGSDISFITQLNDGRFLAKQGYYDRQNAFMESKSIKGPWDNMSIKGPTNTNGDPLGDMDILPNSV